MSVLQSFLFFQDGRARRAELQISKRLKESSVRCCVDLDSLCFGPGGCIEAYYLTAIPMMQCTARIF